jgi:hypothetical protein
MIRHLVLSLMLAASAYAAESFEDMQRSTDMTSADSVFALANWCAENRMPTKAQQLYRQVLKIDKDHFGANNAMGMVLVGDRWVNKAFLPKAQDAGKEGAEGGPLAARANSAPGPATKDVAWDLTIVPDAGPADNPFLDRYIEQMRTAGNDSDQMGAAVATLLREDNWPSAYPRLCKALLTPGYGDVYGACEMILLMRRQDRLAEIRRFFPFVVKASESVTNPEDLEHFAMIAISVRDRRSVPRLTELLAHPAKNVQDTAREALAVITRLPERELTTDKVKAWWNANWSLSEDRILAEQLRSSDPLMAAEAAAGLCEMRNKDIFPVLFKLLRSEDSLVVKKAVSTLQRATSLDWGISPGMPIDQRAKRVDALEKWWKDEHIKFAWPGLPAEDGGHAPAGASAPDPDRDSVGLLASTTGSEAQESESRLRSRGRDAVPALLKGLESANPLIRRRAHDILRETSKKDFGFDPREDDTKRAAAIEAWRAWAVSEKLVVDPTGQEKSQGH